MGSDVSTRLVIPRDDATIEGEVFLNKVRMSQLNINQNTESFSVNSVLRVRYVVSQRTPLLREKQDGTTLEWDLCVSL